MYSRLFFLLTSVYASSCIRHSTAMRNPADEKGLASMQSKGSLSRSILPHQAHHDGEYKRLTSPLNVLAFGTIPTSGEWKMKFTPDPSLEMQDDILLLDMEGLLIFSNIMLISVLTLCASAHSSWGNSGYAIAFATALNCLCMNNVVHYADKKVGLPFGFCVLARTVALTFGALAIGRVRRDPVCFFPSSRDLQGRVAMRAIFGFTSVIALFFALTRAPILICLGMFYSNSIWSALISYFTLQESLRREEVLAMLIGVAAVLLIVRSNASDDNASAAKGENMVLGISLALFAAVADAAAAVVNRSCRGQVHHITLMFWQAGLGAALSLVGAVVYPEHFVVWPLSPLQILTVAGVVVSSFMVQLTINQCYMLEKTGPLQVFINAMVVIPQLGLDLALGYQHKLSTWAGLILMVVYLGVSWRAMHQKDAEASQALVESETPKKAGLPGPLLSNTEGTSSRSSETAGGGVVA